MASIWRPGPFACSPSAFAAAASGAGMFLRQVVQVYSGLDCAFLCFLMLCRSKYRSVEYMDKLSMMIINHPPRRPSDAQEQERPSRGPIPTLLFTRLVPLMPPPHVPSTHPTLWSSHHDRKSKPSWSQKRSDRRRQGLTLSM